MAAQLADDVGLGGSDVAIFLGISRMIVEFDGPIAPAGEAPAVGADRIAAGIAARDERKGGGFAGRRGIVEERAKALAGEVFGRRESAEIGDGGVKIDEFYESAGDAGFHAGCGDEEGRTAAAFEEGVLIPPFTLAEVVAVVAE